MKIHKPSDFKPSYGKILDAAKLVPQYVVRDGVLISVQRVEKMPKARLEGRSAWDVLSSGQGLNVTFPQMEGLVEKVTL